MLSDHLTIVAAIILGADRHPMRLRRDIQDQLARVPFVEIGYVFGMCAGVRGDAVGAVFGEVVAEAVDAGAGEDAEDVALLFVEF